MKVENVIQIKSGITINVDMSLKIKKTQDCAKKIIFGILLHVVAHCKYKANIIDDSVITYDEITEMTKTVFIEKSSL